MEVLLAFLKELLASQPMMQVFVGGGTFLVIVYMVTRAAKDKNSLPPPAPGGITDVPPIFAQGPREVVDILRELRELARRKTEDASRIAECVRIIREEARKQTEILERMAEDQRVEHRVQAERHSH